MLLLDEKGDRDLESDELKMLTAEKENAERLQSRRIRSVAVGVWTCPSDLLH